MLSQLLVRIAPVRWGLWGAALIFALAGGLKWHSGVLPDVRARPQAAAPVPNARDVYDRAERATSDKPALDCAYYALCGIRSHDPQTPAVFPTLAETRRLVAENSAEIALVRQGLRDAYQYPPVSALEKPNHTTWDDQTPAALLGLQARLRAANGDWNGAIDSDIDAIQFGVSLQQGDDNFGITRGLERESAGRRDAWAAIDHLTSAQAQGAAKRMAGIIKGSVPFSDALKQIKAVRQTALLESFSRSGWRSKLLGDYYSASSPQTRWQAALLDFRLHTEPPRDIYAVTSEQSDEAIHLAEMPWPLQKSFRAQVIDDPFYYRGWLPGALRRQCWQNDFDALNRLLLVELALRAYRLDRGAYPAALAQLVPAYLPGVPMDPFTDSQPLRYRLADGKPLIYSVGPDAVDNGGVPVRYPLPRPDWSSDYPAVGDTGDLVAGSG